MTAHGLEQAIPVTAVPPAPFQRLVALYRSERFRQPVRVALAMVIAYHVSLAMG